MRPLKIPLQAQMYIEKYIVKYVITESNFEYQNIAFLLTSIFQTKKLYSTSKNVTL